MIFPRRSVGDRLQGLCAAWLVAYLLRPCTVLAKSSSIAGPWWVRPIQELNCTAGAATNEVTVKLEFLSEPRSSTELQRVSSVFDFPTRPLDDTVHATARFDVYAKNRWKENAIAPMKFPRGGCSSLRTLIPDYFHKMFGILPGSKEPCFIKPGRYEFQDKVINWTFPGVPYFFYGHYRLFMAGGQDSVDHMCFGVEIKVFPK